LGHPHNRRGQSQTRSEPSRPAAAAALRPGHIVLALGNHEGAPIASLGIVAIAGPAWHSLRGGTIDSLIRLDLTLSPAAEGGADGALLLPPYLVTGPPAGLLD